METLNNISIWTAEALVASGSAESPVIDLRTVKNPESIMIKASSVLGAADVKIEYAVSKDGVNFGSFDDEDDIISSTNTLFSGANPEGIHTVGMPNPLAPFIKLKVTELTTTLADTLVDLVLILRRSLR